MNRESFISELLEYTPANKEEINYAQRFLKLLKQPCCYSRDLKHAHFTASAWITNTQRSKILLLHHAKLDKWLQPGGHADGEENLLVVAQKEMTEETGVFNYSLAASNFFDIDIHTIPAYKNVPQHEHFDVRFHFIVSEETKIVQNSESKAIRWFDLNEIASVTLGEESIKRMVVKTRRGLVE